MKAILLFRIVKKNNNKYNHDALMSSAEKLLKIFDDLLERKHREAPIKIFTILDAARSGVIHRRLMNTEIRKYCLFENAKKRGLDKVAPYLIEFDRDEPFFKWVLSEGLDKSWGLFLVSYADSRILTIHLRKFVKASDIYGNVFFFRYYDPRVLRVYFPTCTPEEKENFMGPVNYIILEDGEPEKWLTYDKRNIYSVDPN